MRCFACAESSDDIALYGRNKLSWLKTFLDLPNGIPSHDTFRRVFVLIDRMTFEAALLSWVGTLVCDFDREVVAIDNQDHPTLVQSRPRAKPVAHGK